MKPKNLFSVGFPILIGIIVFAALSGSALSANGALYAAIFCAVVVGLILEPIPGALVGLAGVALIAALGLLGDPKESVKWALSGFSNGVIWLIFAAFNFAKGFEKTGLGRRIAFFVIGALGKRTLTLGYAVAIIDLVLAPFIPSNTARSAGTIYPIVKNIPLMYGSTPESEPRKIGSFLMWIGIASTCVTSSLFLTGLAPNLLAVSIVEKTLGLKISWGAWFAYAAAPMAFLFIITPLLTYWIYPPTLKESNEAPTWAKSELAKLGPLTGKEIALAVLFLVTLLMWIFGGKLLNGTTVAICALTLMALFNIITIDDVTGNKAAWNVFIWFATLVTLAAGLGKVGFLSWFGAATSGYVSAFGPMSIAITLVLVFFFAHYFFASVTAHTTALLPVMLAIISAGLVPPEMLQGIAITLCLTLGVMGILTPYATGPSPIWYGSGYIPSKTFWGLGLLFGALYIAVVLISAAIFIF